MIINLTSAIDNASLQVGDMAYYVQTETLSNTNSLQVGNDPQLLGEVVEIGYSFINVNANSQPPVGSFIMFLKNYNVNNGRLKGYYAEISMKHKGVNAAELFAVSSEVTESSKLSLKNVTIY